MDAAGSCNPPGERSPSDALDLALQVYTYPFFSSEDLRDFVASVARGPYPQPRLFVLSSDRDRLSPPHLLARVPVYYGRPVEGAYRDDVLKQLTGFSTAEALGVSGPAFAIGGRTQLFGRRGRRSVTVLHGWGLNFEGRGTDDFRRFVSGGRLRADDAARELSRRVFLWASAAAALAGPGSRARLRLPAIGFGAFLSALPDRAAVPLLRVAFVDALCFAAAALRQQVTLDLQDRGGVFAGESEALVAGGVLYASGSGSDLFADPGDEADEEGNLVVPAPAWAGGGAGTRERLVLLNAWDDRSFIGNGGSQDPTVDGFMVAGHGPNKRLQNASYLFNPFISRGLLRQCGWEVVDEAPLQQLWGRASA